MTIRTTTKEYYIVSFLDEVPGILAFTVPNVPEAELIQTFGDASETALLTISYDQQERTFRGFTILENVFASGDKRVEIGLRKSEEQ